MSREVSGQPAAGVPAARGEVGSTVECSCERQTECSPLDLVTGKV